MGRNAPVPGDAIFPTFFMAGFERSTFVWKDRQREDYVTATGHDRHLEDDLAGAMDLGIGVVREAIRRGLAWLDSDPRLACWRR